MMRAFGGWLFTGLILGAFFPALSAEGRPNVLFIAIDDLNDWVGGMGGHPQVKTPHMEKLAGGGVYFKNAHCQAPICNPSRASMLHGVLPSTSGIYDLNQPASAAPALKAAISLPAWFKQNGYQVMGRGKIYHGRYARPDEWHDFEQTGSTRKKPGMNYPLSKIPGIRIRDFGPVDIDPEEMQDMINARWAEKKLKEKYKDPFFMAVGIRLPHLPLYAPQEYFDMYPLKKIKLPEILKNDVADLPPSGLRITKYMDGTPLNHKSVLKSGNWKAAVRAYLACTAFVDDCIGVIMNALVKSKYNNNTIVILWSDHGWHLGKKELWAKRSLWEESTRVPVIISGPGISKDKICTRTVGLIDIYPTLMELCDFPNPPQKLEGHSMAPLLRNPSEKWKWPAITTFHRNDHSIRTENHRYIRYANGDEEFYHNSKDKNEWNNLISNPEYKNIIEQHRNWLPKKNQENAPAIKRGRK